MWLSWRYAIPGLASVILSSCSGMDSQVSTAGATNADSYLADSRLMTKMCDKFAEERDAGKLHEVVVAIQLNQPIACSDHYGECEAYHSFLNEAVAISEDGVISDDERQRLREKARELRGVVIEGSRKYKTRFER
jgi:hypothetical protein